MNDQEFDQEKAHRDGMQRLAFELDQLLNGVLIGQNRQIGFVALMFPFGQHSNGAQVNFVTNGANRDDVIALFKAMLARLEGQPETVGTA